MRGRRSTTRSSRTSGPASPPPTISRWRRKTTSIFTMTKGVAPAEPRLFVFRSAAIPAPPFPFLSPARPCWRDAISAKGAVHRACRPARRRRAGGTAMARQDISRRRLPALRISRGRFLLPAERLGPGPRLRRQARHLDDCCPVPPGPADPPLSGASPRLAADLCRLVPRGPSADQRTAARAAVLARFLVPAGRLAGPPRLEPHRRIGRQPAIRTLAPAPEHRGPRRNRPHRLHRPHCPGDFARVAGRRTFPGHLARPPCPRLLLVSPRRAAVPAPCARRCLGAVLGCLAEWPAAASCPGVARSARPETAARRLHRRHSAAGRVAFRLRRPPPPCDRPPCGGPRRHVLSALSAARRRFLGCEHAAPAVHKKWIGRPVARCHVAAGCRNRPPEPPRRSILRPATAPLAVGLSLTGRTATAGNRKSLNSGIACYPARGGGIKPITKTARYRRSFTSGSNCALRRPCGEHQTSRFPPLSAIRDDFMAKKPNKTLD